MGVNPAIDSWILCYVWNSACCANEDCSRHYREDSLPGIFGSQSIWMAIVM